jgi:hypothetical protein
MDVPGGTRDQRGIGVAFGGDEAGGGKEGEIGSEAHGGVRCRQAGGREVQRKGEMNQG